MRLQKKNPTLKGSNGKENFLSLIYLQQYLSPLYAHPYSIDRKAAQSLKTEEAVGCSPISSYAWVSLCLKAKGRYTLCQALDLAGEGTTKSIWLCITRYSENRKLLAELFRSWDLKQDVTLVFHNKPLFCLSLYSQSPMMWLISSIFQDLLSHTLSNWKECHIISSVHQTRYSEVCTR